MNLLQKVYFKPKTWQHFTPHCKHLASCSKIHELHRQVMSEAQSLFEPYWVSSGSHPRMCPAFIVVAPSPCALHLSQHGLFHVRRLVCVADMDECSSPGMCRNGTCSNIRGSYRCICHAGFTLTESGDCFGKCFTVSASPSLRVVSASPSPRAVTASVTSRSVLGPRD